MPRIQSHKNVVVIVKNPAGDEEVTIISGHLRAVQDGVASVRLDAAIKKHDSHNERASPKRYGRARCLTCKKSIDRRPYNECHKCQRYVCPDCRLGMHDAISHTVRYAL